MLNIEHWDPSSEDLQLAAEAGAFFFKNDFLHTKRDKEKKVICNLTAQIIPATSDGGRGPWHLETQTEPTGEGESKCLSPSPEYFSHSYDSF